MAIKCVTVSFHPPCCSGNTLLSFLRVKFEGRTSYISTVLYTSTSYTVAVPNLRLDKLLVADCTVLVLPPPHMFGSAHTLRIYSGLYIYIIKLDVSWASIVMCHITVIDVTPWYCYMMLLLLTSLDLVAAAS